MSERSIFRFISWLKPSAVFLFFLLVLFILLQYRLWFGEGSLAQVWHLKQQIAHLEQVTAGFRQRNQALEVEVNALKYSDSAVEALARMELGMVKEGETFYQIVEKPRSDDAPQ